MTRKSGYLNWPPRWFALNSENDDKPEGEVGGLEDVDMHTLIDNKIFLFMRWQGYRYLGILAFDDAMFCRQVLEVMKIHIGESIQKIGDLDISHLL